MIVAGNIVLFERDTIFPHTVPTQGSRHNLYTYIEMHTEIIL
jgi:hypothetical protein